jgi:hypothetical protein
MFSYRKSLSPVGAGTLDAQRTSWIFDIPNENDPPWLGDINTFTSARVSFLPAAFHRQRLSQVVYRFRTRNAKRNSTSRDEPWVLQVLVPPLSVMSLPAAAQVIYGAQKILLGLLLLAVSAVGQSSSNRSSGALPRQ